MAQTRRLIVEGKQDYFVFDHICYAHGIKIDLKVPESGAFELKNHTGFSRLRDELKVALKGSNLSHIGVVVDADEVDAATGLSIRWASIRDLFRDNGYDCPDRPNPAGLVLKQQDRPTVGLWVMPDNISGVGKLESFVAALIPPDSKLWPWAQGAAATVPGCEERFEDKDREKAEIHLYLAVQKEPGTAMGSGVRKQYFDAQADLAVRFVTWLRSVMEL